LASRQCQFQTSNRSIWDRNVNITAAFFQPKML
jgi:hypothetical protein